MGSVEKNGAALLVLSCTTAAMRLATNYEKVRAASDVCIYYLLDIKQFQSTAR